MLGKLLKDELKSYRFSFGIVFLSGVLFTIFLKVITIIPYRTYAIQEMMQGLAVSMEILIFTAMAVAVQVLVIVRFYSTMVGDRGYLTWTIPASSGTHLWTKLIGGVLWKLLAAVVMVILLILFFAGDYWAFLKDIAAAGMVDIENISLGSILYRELQDVVNSMTAIDVLYSVLQLTTLFILTVFGTLIIYMCMGIGQLFGKWRILASIGSYFLVIVILQIISVVIALIPTFYTTVEYTDDVYAVGMREIGQSILGIAISLAGCAVVFVLTNYIFKKHLNLD